MPGFLLKKVEQQASIKHQEEHFEELIHSNNRWKFAGSYIDDGISGIHADKEKNFKECSEMQSSEKLT